MSQNRFKTRMYSPFLLIILFLMPAFLPYKDDLVMLCDAWRLLQIAATVFLLLRYFTTPRIHNNGVNLIILYYAWVSVACLANGESPGLIRWEIIPDIGISLFANAAMHKSKERFFKSAACVFVVYVFINWISMWVYPDGIASGRIGQPFWIIGTKNNAIPYVLVAGVLLSLHAYMVNGRNTGKVRLVISLMCASTLSTNSSTAILLGILVFCGIWAEAMIRNRRVLNFLFEGKKNMLLIALMFLFVVIYGTNSPVMEGITSWLGRDITISGRTALWGHTIQTFLGNPLFGVGPVFVIDVGWGEVMTHAHNLYLNIAAKYGAVALGLFVVVIGNAMRKRRREHSPMAFFFFTVYLAGSIVEVYATNTLSLACIALLQYASNRKEVTGK